MQILKTGTDFAALRRIVRSNAGQIRNENELLTVFFQRRLTATGYQTVNQNFPRRPAMRRMQALARNPAMRVLALSAALAC
jgi:hypothetical protein